MSPKSQLNVRLYSEDRDLLKLLAFILDKPEAWVISTGLTELCQRLAEEMVVRRYDELEPEKFGLLLKALSASGHVEFGFDPERRIIGLRNPDGGVWGREDLEGYTLLGDSVG